MKDNRKQLLKCCSPDGMEGSNKKQMPQKKKKASIKCKNYRNKIRLNTFTSNIIIQSKRTIFYQFQWIDIQISVHIYLQYQSSGSQHPGWSCISIRMQIIQLDTTNFQIIQFCFTHNQLAQSSELSYPSFPLPSVALTCFKFTHGIQVTPWFPSLMLGMLIGPNRVVNAEKAHTTNRSYAFIQILLQLRSIPNLLTQAKPEKKLNYIFHKDT